MKWTKGQIFEACRISATSVSAPKRLKVVLNTNIFFSSKWNLFLELRHVSLRYDKHQKFDLKSSDRMNLLNNPKTFVFYKQKHMFSKNVIFEHFCKLSQGWFYHSCFSKTLEFFQKKTTKMRESKVFSLLKKKVLGLFANLTLCQLAKKL
jgi:hypothetical protein